MMRLSEHLLVPVKAWVPFSGRHASVRRWKRFADQYRRSGEPLLAALDTFRDPILVSGCQRSGGTLLTDLVTRGPGMGDIAHDGDRELAGALLLAGGGGAVVRRGRLCFQTTYLNDRYREYLEQSRPFHLVWLIRRPASVVRSMLYNWSRYALNELFESCAVPGRRPGGAGVSALRRACCAYVAKNEQLLELAESSRLSLMVVDYDDLVGAPEAMLERILGFAGVPWAPGLGQGVRPTTSAALPAQQQERVESWCASSYRQVRALAVQPGGGSRE